MKFVVPNFLFKRSLAEDFSVYSLSLLIRDNNPEIVDFANVIVP